MGHKQHNVIVSSGGSSVVDNLDIAQNVPTQNLPGTNVGNLGYGSVELQIGRLATDAVDFGTPAIAFVLVDDGDADGGKANSAIGLDLKVIPGQDHVSAGKFNFELSMGLRAFLTEGLLQFGDHPGCRAWRQWWECLFIAR